MGGRWQDDQLGALAGGRASPVPRSSGRQCAAGVAWVRDIGSAGVFERQALLSPHNLYFLLASELGIPAATCFSLLIFGSIVLCGVLVIRAGAHDRLRTATGLAAIGMLIGVAIDGLFGDLGGPSVISMGWAIGLGVCFSRVEDACLGCQARKRRAETRRKRAGRRSVGGSDWWRADGWGQCCSPRDWGP